MQFGAIGAVLTGSSRFIAVGIHTFVLSPHSRTRHHPGYGLSSLPGYLPYIESLCTGTANAPATPHRSDSTSANAP